MPHVPLSVPIHDVEICFPRDVQPISFDPLSVKLSYLNFTPFEVVTRYRDPQLQVRKNCLISDQTFANRDKKTNEKRLLS